uniref:Zgc:153990 n=1 Tax=Tetraodon nigroviridis TaxID=99883 RepID=H3C3P3_TETNG
GSSTRFRKRKARFSDGEVHVLLSEVRRNRRVVVGKFNRGVPSDVKKRTWAEITARINKIGECRREVIEVVKKWSDLKCDTKRKVDAMQAGLVPNRSLNSRFSKGLNPTEKIVHSILEMKEEDHSSGDFGPLEDDDDLMIGLQSLPNGLATFIFAGRRMAWTPRRPYPLPLPRRPPKVQTHRVAAKLVTRTFEMTIHVSLHKSQLNIKQLVKGGNLKFCIDLSCRNQDAEATFGDSDEDQKSDLLPYTRLVKQTENLKNNGVLKPGPPRTSSGPSPASQKTKEAMLQSASQSLQEQHATNVLLETVSRSLELLSESVQQLAETQQEFVRESLQIQRETVQVLRDFTGGAIALMHDKLNGRP